jgi:hypothetical protein
MFITNIIALSLLGFVSMGSEKEAQPAEPVAISEVKKFGTDPTSCEIIEFEESESSTSGITTVAYSNGTPVNIAAFQRQPDGSYKTENASRLFDTGAPAATLPLRTPNTNAMRPMGRVLLVGNGAGSDTEMLSGRIEMDFTAMGSITLKGIHVLDIEQDEAGSTVELYNQSGKLIKSMPLPVTGTHGATRLRIDTPGVQKMVVTFNSKNNKSGNGAIDVIEFCRD